MRASPSGAGSQPTTSRPAARNWAAQPLPMVPRADDGDASDFARFLSHRSFLPRSPSLSACPAAAGSVTLPESLER